MSSLADNANFIADYEKLKAVSLNPERHTADNAHDHCERVRAKALHLASLNNCTDREAALLQQLAYLHDIGKIEGAAKPAKSVELLPRYGIEDPDMINLVKYHDTNLHWYIAVNKGQEPGDNAWRRLAKQVDMRLLCLFMVADRVDCPGGWRGNAPLNWFLREAERRKLVKNLVLDDGRKTT